MFQQLCCDPLNYTKTEPVINCHFPSLAVLPVCISLKYLQLTNIFSIKLIISSTNTNDFLSL